jgi:hypothetical protein
MAQRDKSVDSPSDLGTPWALTGTSFEFAEQAYSNWLANTERIQSEAFEFLNARIEKVLATARELGSCTNPADYFALQAKYAQGALADWFAEGQKIADLVGEIAQSPTEHGAKRKSHARRSANGHHSRAAH